MQNRNISVHDFFATPIFTCKTNFGKLDFLNNDYIVNIIVFNMIAEIRFETQDTEEMQNCTGDKSILAVLEQIHLKASLEHGQLLFVCLFVSIIWSHRPVLQYKRNAKLL